jgi:hypothetical protein
MSVDVGDDTFRTSVQYLAIQDATRRGDRMKRDRISCIKKADVLSDTILSKRPLFSLHALSGNNKQATIWIDWQAGGIVLLIGMGVMLKAMYCNNPPPGRYISM